MKMTSKMCSMRIWISKYDLLFSKNESYTSQCAYIMFQKKLYKYEYFSILKFLIKLSILQSRNDSCYYFGKHTVYCFY